MISRIATMIRSLCLLAFMTHQIESLISVAQLSSSRRTFGKPGKLEGKGNGFQRPELVEALADEKLELANYFDTDKYRQEMVDLVYQQSMERAFS